MKPYSILTVAAVASTLSGCTMLAKADPGPRAQRNYAVSDFRGIEVAGRYDVTVRTGIAPSVKANGGEKELDQLRVEVRNGVLEIAPIDHHSWFGFGGWSHRGGPVTLIVTVPSLASASLAGSGAINVDKVSGARFKGEIAGSGDLALASVNVSDVSLEIAGSGNVRAAGKARNVSYEIAGSGDIDASGLASETAKVSIAGSGGIRGHATGTASIEIAGSGDVDLTGGAKCSVSKNGSGNVRCS